MKRHILCLAIAAAVGLPLQAIATPNDGVTAQTTAPVSARASSTSDTQNKPSDAEQQRADVKELQTVTVTARRRDESLERVPVAVSAFSSEDLKDLDASNIDGLQGAVPGLNIVQGRGSSSAVNVFIRGIGQPDALQTFDPGVGMYVDDVYYSRIQGALFTLFDVDHIEVLRGAQGTLYGKNSTGGAIKIITKKPSQRPTASVELKTGSYNLRQGQFYVSGPLSDTLSGSLAGVIVKDDGYVTDPVTDHKYNDQNTKAIRGKLRWEPGEQFNATLALDYTKQDTALTLGQPTADLTSTDLLTGQTNVLLPVPPFPKYDFKSRTSFGPGQGQKLTNKGVALHMNWNLDEQWLIKSISAYRKLHSSSYIDIDASQFELGDVLVDFPQQQVSEELQLQYNSDTVHAVYGLYYLRESVPSHQEAYANDFLTFGGAPIDFLRTIDDNQLTHSYAGFANVNWEFAPTWTLALGARYTRETKHYQRTTSAFFGPPLAALSQDPQAVIEPTSKTWSAVTPSLSLQKQFTPQVMGYVSANRGFKSGGFNGRANSPALAADPTFDPETVWTYEAGLKMRSADNRLQANIAAYHSNYSDFQARVSDIVDPGSATPSFEFPVINAAKLNIDGLEFEGTALLGEGTRLSTQLAWMHARYDKFEDHRLNPADPEYNPDIHKHVPFSPEFTARVALSHTFGFNDGGALTVGADAKYRSDTWLSVDNRPGLMQKDFVTSDLFGVYDAANGHWQLRAGVRNLGDKVYKTDAQEFSSVGNIQTAYYAMPRNWYISARYNF